MQRRCWCSQRAGAAADARGSASRPPRRHLGDAAAPICSHTPHQRGTRAPHTPLPPPHICSVRGASCSSGGLTALLPQPPRDARERPARRLGALLLKHGARLIQRRGRAHHRRERVLPRGPSPRRCPLKRAAVASRHWQFAFVCMHTTVQRSSHPRSILPLAARSRRGLRRCGGRALLARRRRGGGGGRPLHARPGTPLPPLAGRGVRGALERRAAAAAASTEEEVTSERRAKGATKEEA